MVLTDASRYPRSIEWPLSIRFSSWGEKKSCFRRPQRGLQLLLLMLFQFVQANSRVYRYNICNGLSNQLLYHSASIARAGQQNMKVQIPNHFIVDGTQPSDDPVLPSAANSVPLESIFDTEYLLKELHEIGISASLHSFDFTGSTKIECVGMQGLQGVKPDLVLQVLKLFRPSRQVHMILQNIISSIQDSKLSIDKGICLHHRNGVDWHVHCQRWSGIQDGVYRGNCLQDPERNFTKALESRGMTQDRWIYYCGDHEIPDSLRAYRVTSHRELAFQPVGRALEELAGGNGTAKRDLWAVIDFFMCDSFPLFIGNSVSTFSAIQIAFRSTNAFWYNSQSIPLSTILPIYYIPIVYTYTELNQKSGKYLLQASIASVRQHMPHNLIHILYHGAEDVEFRQWLRQQNVTIHDHDPQWKDQIDEFRRDSRLRGSHLSLHSGDFFGSWQRVDIPWFVDSEYCLQLDVDTVITRSFTLADFGLNLTFGLALSSEMEFEPRPSNAGVMLMNVPRMRDTYDDFLEYTLTHVSRGRFDHPSPMYQEAYNEFYRGQISLLPNVFNFKPYWELDYLKSAGSPMVEPFIVHFHGPKPHDYITNIMKVPCANATL